MHISRRKFIRVALLSTLGAMRFDDYTGIYVYHCHNLEHEDMGMMRNYEVVE